jgi:hypothetical protein
MLRRLWVRIFQPRCPLELPPDTVTDDAAKRAFKAEQHAIKRDLEWLKHEVELRRVRRRKR